MVSEAFEESIVIIQILKLLKPACTQTSISAVGSPHATSWMRKKMSEIIVN